MSINGLSAQVRTDDGWAVPHAVMTVIDLTGNQVSRVTTDQDGVVTTEPLPAGNYTAIITAVGYTPVAKSAIVTANGASTLGTVQLPRVGGVQLPPPGPWTIDPVHSTIGFTARHLGVANVRGRFSEFSGRIEVGEPIERSSVHTVINTSSIDTNNSMRDKHLRSSDLLEVERYPTMEFHCTGLTHASDSTWALDGELTLHGETRPVRLDVSYQGVVADPWGFTRASFKATTELHRDDFTISYNQIVQAGIMIIGTTVRVEIDIEAVQGTSLPGVEADDAETDNAGTTNHEAPAPSGR